MNPPLDIDLQHSAHGLVLRSVFIWLCIVVGGFGVMQHLCWLVDLPKGCVVQGFEAASFHFLRISRHRQSKNFCLACAPCWPIFIDTFAVRKHRWRAHQRISTHTTARTAHQRAVEGFELSVFFAFVDVLSQAIGYVETRQASSVTRPEGLHESRCQFVMRIKCERGVCQYLLHICATYRLRPALNEFCICLEVHILERVASMQPVISQ